MKAVRTYWIVICLVLVNVMVAFAEPSLTIYNQDFAVVRDWINPVRHKDCLAFSGEGKLPEKLFFTDYLF
jgi:hypothetical protein